MEKIIILKMNPIAHVNKNRARRPHRNINKITVYGHAENAKGCKVVDVHSVTEPRARL